MITRDLEPRLISLASQYPVLTVTGPRQSGKTTLCRQVFPDHPYVSLEEPDTRRLAAEDPRGFLSGLPEGGLIDEVQRVPDLLSYIQVLVDERGKPGEWILTGSQNLGLLESVSQSLAGRTAILHLLPPSLSELQRFSSPPTDLLSTLVTGAYPKIYDRQIDAATWLGNYVATYVERDVRSVINVADLPAFEDFLRQCAGRSGQLLNLSSLGADCGITQPTAKAWLGVLEACFIAFRLPPLHRNLRKRLTKARKLYFYDSGLLCWLLGIHKPEDLATHPLRGAVFETWVVSEIIKQRLHRGASQRMNGGLFFYRDQPGQEVDVIIQRGTELLAVEVKAGRTVPSDVLPALLAWGRMIQERDVLTTAVHPVLVYGGDQAQTRSDSQVVPWHELGNFDWCG